MDWRKLQGEERKEKKRKENNEIRDILKLQ